MAVVRQAQEHGLMSVEDAQSFKEGDASNPDSPVVLKKIRIYRVSLKTVATFISLISRLPRGLEI